MHRLAHVEEIAEAVRFLSGEESSYMTGQSIVVDGGWIVQGIPEAPEWLQASDSSSPNPPEPR
jgi:3-oxoacyl-[acyl-carrier protein] reductase